MAKDLQKAGNDGVAMAGASGYEASWMIDTYLNTLATPAQYRTTLHLGSPVCRSLLLILWAVPEGPRCDPGYVQG